MACKFLGPNHLLQVLGSHPPSTPRVFVNRLEGLGVDDVWRRKPPLDKPALYNFQRGQTWQFGYWVRVDFTWPGGWMLVLKNCCWFFVDVCWLLLDLLGCCWMLVVVGCCCCWWWYWKIMFFLLNYSNMRIHPKYLSRLVPNDILKMLGCFNHTDKTRVYTPENKTWIPKMMVWKWWLLLNMAKFLGCTYLKMSDAQKHVNSSQWEVKVRIPYNL